MAGSSHQDIFKKTADGQRGMTELDLQTPFRGVPLGGHMMSHVDVVAVSAGPAGCATATGGAQKSTVRL